MENFCFKVLSAEDVEFSHSVEAIKAILDPLYGVAGVAKLIEKVRIGKDRICEVYYEEDVPRGLIIFKNFLSNEYAEFGITNGFEEKTTLPMIPEDKAQRRFALRKKIMNILLHRAVTHAIEMKAETFFGTVTEEKKGTLNFLLDLGFEIAHVFKDKFKQGVDEYLVVHKNLEKFYHLTRAHQEKSHFDFQNK